MVTVSGGFAEACIKDTYSKEKICNFQILDLVKSENPSLPVDPQQVVETIGGRSGDREIDVEG